MTQEAPGDLAVQKLRTFIAEKASKLRPGSPERYRLLETLELSDEALIDKIYSQVEPNPDRVGCPPRAVLIQLAQRTRPLTDPWWDHIMVCSPCRIDVRELGRELPVAPKGVTWGGRRWATAAVLALAVGLTVSFLLGRSINDGGRPIAITGDLRKYAMTRSGQAPQLEQPLLLSRGHLRLTLLLPSGSETGPYELQLLDAERGTHATGAGEAILRELITSLNADLDLSSVASGAYQLAIRRAGEDWQLFPARVE